MLNRIKSVTQDVLLFVVISASLATYKLVSITSKIFKKKKRIRKEYYCHKCGSHLTRGSGVYVHINKRAYSFCHKCIQGVTIGSFQGKKRMSKLQEKNGSGKRCVLSRISCLQKMLIL